MDCVLASIESVWLRTTCEAISSSTATCTLLPTVGAIKGLRAGFLKCGTEDEFRVFGCLWWLGFPRHVLKAMRNFALDANKKALSEEQRSTKFEDRPCLSFFPLKS